MKRFKRSLESKEGNLHERFTQEDIQSIDWLIERYKTKRDEIEAAYKTENKKYRHINDCSYDIRDLKPYKFYIHKLEKDMQMETAETPVPEHLNPKQQTDDNQNEDLKLEDISEEEDQDEDREIVNHESPKESETSNPSVKNPESAPKKEVSEHTPVDPDNDSNVNLDEEESKS